MTSDFIFLDMMIIAMMLGKAMLKGIMSAKSTTLLRLAGGPLTG